MSWLDAHINGYSSMDELETCWRYGLVSFDPGSMVEGTCSKFIFGSNDPQNSHNIVPVTMNLTGLAQLMPGQIKGILIMVKSILERKDSKTFMSGIPA